VIPKAHIVAWRQFAPCDLFDIWLALTEGEANAAMKKDECNAAEGRLGRSDLKETDSLKGRLA
jgi:hypothetical protein